MLTKQLQPPRGSGIGWRESLRLPLAGSRRTRERVRWFRHRRVRPSEAATQERDRVNRLIDAALRRRSIGRSCRRCGCRLPRRHQFAICEDCYRGNRYDDY
jgi:hypothetical protein